MDTYKETAETWNEIAQLYQDTFMHLDLYDGSYDLFCQGIEKSNANILEIGCGPGNISKYLISKQPNYSILGIDVAPNMIALAQKNNPTAIFKVMDCRKINELPKTYDGIIAGFCLPYLSPEDACKLISDSYNLLNQNGLIYISFVEGDPSKSGFQTGSGGHRSYFYFHQLNQLEKQLIDCHFHEIEVLRVAYKKSELEEEFHTILLAKKKVN
jgi:cyclopropane fatty-acyl-phospholipid synthase-like methyltransferase